MFIKTLIALSVAILVGIGAAGFVTTSANAHTKRFSPSVQATANIHDVVTAGGEYAGRDPDANVRVQLRREFGLSNH